MMFGGDGKNNLCAISFLEVFHRADALWYLVNSINLEITFLSRYILNYLYICSDRLYFTKRPIKAEKRSGAISNIRKYNLLLTLVRLSIKHEHEI